MSAVSARGRCPAAGCACPKLAVDALMVGYGEPVPYEGMSKDEDELLTA
jgi:hypothetical protein